MMAGAIGLPVIKAGKIENRFTKRLAGNSHMVNADTANAAGAIDNRHSLAKLGALDRGLLPGRAGADNCQIVLSIHGRQALR
jgi:hypothetical protein